MTSSTRSKWAASADIANQGSDPPNASRFGRRQFSDNSHTTATSAAAEESDLAFRSRNKTILKPLSPPPSIQDLAAQNSTSTDSVEPDATLKDARERDRLQAKLDRAKRRAAQLQVECEKNRDLVNSIVALDTTPSPQPAAHWTAIQSILSYCIDMGLSQTAEILQREAPPILAQRLQEYLQHHAFSGAIYIVQLTFEDLLYILQKYAFLDRFQNQDYTTAFHTLIQIQMAKDSTRGAWFYEDYTMLEGLLHSVSSQSQYFLQPSANSYIHWDWARELETFWSSAMGPNVPGVTPLDYSSPLPIPALSLNSNNTVGLLDAMAAHQFRDGVRNVVDRSGVVSNYRPPPPTESSVITTAPAPVSAPVAPVNLLPANILQPEMIPERRGSTQSTGSSSSSSNSNTLNNSNNSYRNVNITQPTAPKKKVSIDMSQTCIQSYNVSEPSIVVEKADRGNGDKPNKSFGTTKSAIPTIEEFDRRSTASSNASTTLLPELDKLMPPPSKETETADFALSTTCGPVLGHIRTLDIQPTMTPSNQIIIATAGVVFHPTNPDLLLTADMEFCVKLWDWKQSILVRSWKKHHSRVIWKVAFVPGRETFAASCSGDQSLKIWDTSDPKPTISSVHANEPFTSFVFCGDPSEQTLIASLSYTLRIYKMRTMSLVHTIQLKDLKVNKTPVYSVSSHPLYDNYILISCDNQIRLFDLSSETMLRVFSAREIGAGVRNHRIEGMFSPCGTFVYSGSCDVRSLASNSSVRRTSGMQNVVDDGKSVGEEGVNSRKLERSEMRAMESGEKRIPVTVCKWIQVDGNSKSNRKREEKARKVLVAATFAGTVKLYL
ncbi:WD40 repeat-like protein [Rhizoclosmatium globosum]|uniref:WD40 repeat-like protein n=1 Tax=Rhizoclosmatium globosum TaxID=329046 RepID=A0A1Y2CL78_9FUNG|nr:WD40 repeat-like protein [Rhizoclosmatium globosum]|eukprot:ORY47781.1 WD40 repeat-like protein [Rhizoclosmatium globosum]